MQIGCTGVSVGACVILCVCGGGEGILVQLSPEFFDMCCAVRLELLVEISR